MIVGDLMMLLEHPYSPTLPGFTGRLNGVPSADRVLEGNYDIENESFVMKGAIQE